MYLVYKLTNSANGKAYIGITARGLADRWWEHTKRAREGVRQSRLYAAIRKYGPHSFRREVIATYDDPDDIRGAEKVFIRLHGTYVNGYNSNLGGHGHLHFSPELRKKIGDAQRGKVITPECRAKMSAAKKGDPRCAAQFGEHTQKGAKNPRAKSYRIRFPDGSEHVITGLRAFCRDTNTHTRNLKEGSHSKGYKILESIDDPSISVILSTAPSALIEDR